MMAGPRPPVTPNNVTRSQRSEEAAAIFIYECSAFVPAFICANISHSWLTFLQMLRHKDGGSDAESVLKYWDLWYVQSNSEVLSSLRSCCRGTRKRNNTDA